MLGSRTLASGRARRPPAMGVAYGYLSRWGSLGQFTRQRSHGFSRKTAGNGQDAQLVGLGKPRGRSVGLGTASPVLSQNSP